MKMACGDRKAAFRVAILDPDVTVSQPAAVTAITGVDALSHALEAYVTTKRNPVAQMFAREAWKLLEANLGSGAGAARRHRGPRRHAGRRLPRRHGDRELDARGDARLRQSPDGPLRHHARRRDRHSPAHVVRFNASTVGSLYGELVEHAGLLNGDPGAAGEILARRVGECMRAANLPTTLSVVRRQFRHPAGAGRGSQPAVDGPLQPPPRDRDGSAILV